MNNPVIRTSETVIIIGGGAVGPDDLEEALVHTRTVVAADGGADAARAHGVVPAAVIGDMDSVTEATVRATAPDRFHRIAEQDSTDFDKAIRHVDAPCILAVGFAGGRMDHQMAALHTMVARAHQPCLLLAAEDVVFVCPPRLSLPVAAGTRVSLFPMGPVTGQSSGLQWPIDGIAFAPDGRSGTSNRATGPVSLAVDTPHMLCFLPRSCLALALRELAALPSSPGRWPVRASGCKDRLQS